MMKDEVLRRMDELGCEPNLRALIEQLPAAVDVVINEGVGDFLPLSGAPGAVAAVYMNVRHCHIALDPPDAAALAESTGGRLSARARTTHRVRITAAMASDPELQPLIVENVVRALRRSAGSQDPPSEPTVSGGLDFPCVLLRISKAWQEGMDVDAVYDVTRGWWVLGAQREQAAYAVAVAKGVVRGVFAIHGWVPRHLADDGSPADHTRWGFDGEPSEDHEHLVGVDVSHLFPPGAANPVRYLNLDASPPAMPSLAAWEADRATSQSRTSTLQALCAELAQNPLLYLSLHSKELFHSNLLGWVFGRSAEVAEVVLAHLLEPQPDHRRHAVEFERHHLDLVVRLPGHRPVVLENKVFSLPDEDQLDGYAAHNIPAAVGAAGATKVLLSLTDPAWPDARYGGWTWLSYGEVAASLLPAVEHQLRDDAFTVQLVRHWTEMITVLQRIVDVTAPSHGEPLQLDADAVEQLKDVRLHDVAQKLRARQVRHLLQRHLDQTAVDVDDLESGFRNGTPLLSGRLFMPDGSEVGWQLQGSQWRRFVIVPDHLKGRSASSKQARIAYVQEHHARWFDFAVEQEFGPFQAAPDSSYKHFAPGFLYDYVRVPGITVELVLSLAQAVLTQAAAYRAGWSGPVGA